MKIVVSTVVLVSLFILSGCQGRDMPLHPSQPTPPSIKDINLSKITSSFTFLKKKSDQTLVSKETNQTSTLEEKEKVPVAEIENSKEEITQVVNSSKKQENNISSKLYSAVSSAKNIPILKDIGKLKNISVKEIPILRHIGLLTQYLPTSSGDKVRRIHQKEIKNKKKNISIFQGFSGGMISGNLDMGNIRLEKNPQYTRLIFESYNYEEDKASTKPARYSGIYTASYREETHAIDLSINGYRSFSALEGKEKKIYKEDSIIQDIEIKKSSEDHHSHFIITLKQGAKINVFELHNPARIIIDIAPMYRLFGEAS
jgi:hypothetical protein